LIKYLKLLPAYRLLPSAESATVSKRMATEYEFQHAGKEKAYENSRLSYWR
jgi:hypothetical protein